MLYRTFLSCIYISICLMVVLLVTPTAVSQKPIPPTQPTVIKDINITTLSSSPSSITPYKDRFFFIANDGHRGYELWISNGTEAGTQMVKDIVPGKKSSNPSRLTIIGDRLFFTVNEDRTDNNELWVSDGTSKGTYLVHPIVLSESYAELTNFTDLNGQLFFTAEDENGNFSLWKSNGDPGDMTLVAQLASSGVTGWAEMIAIENTLYIIAQSEVGSNLWKSDGSPDGTAVLKHFGYAALNTAPKDVALSFIPSSNDPIWPFSPRELTNVDGTLFFRGYDEVHGHELWISDGTSEGTRMVVDATAGVISNFPKELTVIGDKLFYVGINYATERGIWSSDGTAEGTREIRSFPRPESPPAALTVVDNMLFFSASDGEEIFNRELWKSDGTAAGTVQVKEIVPGSTGSFPFELTTVNGLLFFSADDPSSHLDRRLWRSDGTAAGTYVVEASVEPTNLVGVNEILFFQGGTQPYYDSELWRSDGTAAGTVEVKDINTRSDNSFSVSLTQGDDTAFFTAFDMVNGWELWRTDGTVQGTTLIRDIQNGENNELSWIPQMIYTNGNLFFVRVNQSDAPELWRSDGTSDGTNMVFDFEQAGTYLRDMTVLDDQLYFISSDDQTLWKSDGTTSGTVPVKQLNHIDHMVNINGTLWLAADNGAVGLWKSDGTTEGTVWVRDIQLGDEFSNGFIGDGFAGIGDDILFAGNDGATGLELWKSDGTTTGTVQVKDIVPGADPSNPKIVTAVGKYVFFTADTRGYSKEDFGEDLWVSDGTTAGTRWLKHIRVDGGRMDATWFTVMGEQLFFLAYDKSQYGLWVSDGTDEGTQLIAELPPYINVSNDIWLTSIDDMLFFSAPNSKENIVLWRSDSTAEGTRPVRNGTPGNTSSYIYNPDHMVFLENALLFSTEDVETGEELWSLPSYAGVAQTVLVPPLFGVPPADEVDIPIRYMNVGRMTAADVRLTVTMDSALTYISDASEITSAIDGEHIVWDLPDMGYLDSAAWNLRVQVPEVPYGTRYRVTVDVSSAEENHHAVPQRAEMEVMVARQTVLPIIGR
ncbi:MAG: hypothetical protein GFH25_541276n9 [Chloroflexi bacterium AL-N10]|nr:hypothetical protein [Chloroflexi bacterium AL-N1]NOK71090.1 hypothetical protein [Chloroflexi bacterium AL-N10]NOK77337.1 hypothetical protein [Chloroflexi bacterium AL-N5]